MGIGESAGARLFQFCYRGEERLYGRRPITPAYCRSGGLLSSA